VSSANELVSFAIQMKAVIHSKYGPPEVLKVAEIETPIPKSGEMLIRIHAATVNRTDTATLRGKPLLMRLYSGLVKPNKRSLGTDFAGEVVQIGKDVKTQKVGDRVFGFDDQGLKSHAEYMTFPEKEAVALIPEKTSYKEAVASIEGAHYAINAINKVKLKEGDKILVNGVTGAIGYAAIQLLLNKGYHLTAVCGTENIELIKSLGVEEVVDYKLTDFTKLGKKYNYVFDLVGKNSFWNCRKVLEPRGIYISSELGKFGANIFYTLFTPIFMGKKVRFPYPSKRLASVLIIQKMLEQKTFKPLIDREYTMENIVEAFKYVESGNKVGNVILRIQSGDSGEN